MERNREMKRKREVKGKGKGEGEGWKIMGEEYAKSRMEEREGEGEKARNRKRVILHHSLNKLNALNILEQSQQRRSNAFIRWFKRSITY